jgi:hypothetical protein
VFLGVELGEGVVEVVFVVGDCGLVGGVEGVVVGW